MRFDGIVVGVAAFLLIGLFHPLVIRCEYYFSKNIWPAFLLAGAALLVPAFCAGSEAVRAVFAVAAFTCFWSIRELFQQEKRVERGWFPENPNRKKKGGPGKDRDVENKGAVK